MGLEAYIFQTKMGWVGISGSEKGLLTLILPRVSFDEVVRKLGIELQQDSPLPGSLIDIVERLNKYFDGYKVSFPDKLDFSKWTGFQRKVWEVTKTIPYGETRSYSWVAEKVGNKAAVRAVGNAEGANPLPIIVPCHRVLAKNGGLGGYGGGIELKRYLLWLEASAFMRDRTS